ncbi:quorum-sensing-regulated virulence factor family protein [Pseudomonas sp. nanlin1]|uniref:quorum-sensing-regulated virulence factor family protein n=1 Tax=Pseudomonas sp. nanlin1 TaxID=3040605 RepID=UPI0038908A3F
MLRLIAPSLALLLTLPFAVQAESLKDFDLGKTLQKVAKQSSVGTPRAINEDILDNGYTVQGKELVDHLSVRPSHAAKMRANPDVVRATLSNSVCGNPGYRQLMAQGAVLRYDFTELKTKKPVARERFTASDCPSNAAK